MGGLTVTMMLQLSLAVSGANTYKEAKEESAERDRPLVVLVGADWCPGCVTMKNSVMPMLQKGGDLDNVSFAIVNTDQQPDLARRLMRGSSIPQLVMYHRTDEGWKRTQITGATSGEQVKQFLSVGVNAQSKAGPVVAKQPDAAEGKTSS